MTVDLREPDQQIANGLYIKASDRLKNGNVYYNQMYGDHKITMSSLTIQEWTIFDANDLVVAKIDPATSSSFNPVWFGTNPTSSKCPPTHTKWNVFKSEVRSFLQFPTYLFEFV